MFLLQDVLFNFFLNKLNTFNQNLLIISINETENPENPQIE